MPQEADPLLASIHILNTESW